MLPEVGNFWGISISCEFPHPEDYKCLKFCFEDANQVCRRLLPVLQLEDEFHAQKVGYICFIIFNNFLIDMWISWTSSNLRCCLFDVGRYSCILKFQWKHSSEFQQRGKGEKSFGMAVLILSDPNLIPFWNSIGGVTLDPYNCFSRYICFTLWLWHPAGLWSVACPLLQYLACHVN